MDECVNEMTGKKEMPFLGDVLLTVAIRYGLPSHNGKAKIKSRISSGKMINNNLVTEAYHSYLPIIFRIPYFRFADKKLQLER